MYYNTTHEWGTNLKENRSVAISQEKLVHELFLDFPYSRFTPADVASGIKARNGKTWPLTSVRRAMTDLTHAGRLIKCSEKKMGIYGKMNYCWELRR